MLAITSSEKNKIHAFIRSLDNTLLDMDYRPGHLRVRNILSELRLVRPKLRIRICGTNGKGSTGRFIESALVHAGYKTGFYTSPHLFSFNERIRVNCNNIDDQTLYPLILKIIDLGSLYRASPFEQATALALNVFSDQNCTMEILECGVGARLDATTAVPAEMAVITPIALDHQAWLGETLVAIADEKAYAMQACRWAISAPQTDEVAEVLRRHRPDVEFVSGGEDLPPLKMAGDHQRCNASLAYAAIRRLCTEGEVESDLRAMMRAVANTRVPGRLQHIRWHGCHLWLDAAHNMHAVRALLPSLPALADPFDVILVFTRENRDLTEALPLLRPFTRRLVAQNGYTESCDAHYDGLRGALEAEIAGRTSGTFLVLGSFTSVAVTEDWLGRPSSAARRESASLSTPLAH